MKKGIVFLFALIGLNLLLLSPTFGQGTDTGTLAGTVQDTNGEALPSASVIITNLGTASTRSVTANDQGRWTAPVLPVGTYNVTVELQGYL